jgi:hypothetical protein
MKYESMISDQIRNGCLWNQSMSNKHYLFSKGCICVATSRELYVPIPPYYSHLVAHTIPSELLQHRHTVWVTVQSIPIYILCLIQP